MARKPITTQPPGKLKVWYHSGEDPPDELDRRFAAVCLYYDIPPEEIADLIITTAQTVPLRVAEGFTEFIEKKELIQCIDDQIGANAIDVAILEPLITLHGVPESDNTAGPRARESPAGDGRSPRKARLRSHPSNLSEKVYVRDWFDGLGLEALLSMRPLTIGTRSVN